jgi:hypothetical protein
VHATYYICCHLLPVQQYHIFPHYLINSTILVGGLFNIRWVFWFFLKLVWNISHSEKKSARYYHTCTYVFNENINYSWRISIKFYFLKIFLKHPQIPNFTKIHPLGPTLEPPTPFITLGWKEKQVLQQHVVRLLYFHQTVNKDQLVCHSNDNTHFLLNFRSTRGWEQLSISDQTGWIF